MFLSFKKRRKEKKKKILNGRQRTELLNQPPRTLRYPARHLVLSFLRIRRGDIKLRTWLPSLHLKKQSKINKQILSQCPISRLGMETFS